MAPGRARQDRGGRRVPPGGLGHRFPFAQGARGILRAAGLPRRQPAARSRLPTRRPSCHRPRRRHPPELSTKLLLPQRPADDKAGLYQDLWLPDERLRFGAHGRARGAPRLCPLGDARRRRSRDPQHLPHSREGGGKGVFRTRRHPPSEEPEGTARRPDAGGGRRLRRPGRGRRDHAAGAVCRHGVWSANLSPPARTHRQSHP